MDANLQGQNVNEQMISTQKQKDVNNIQDLSEEFQKVTKQLEQKNREIDNYKQEIENLQTNVLELKEKNEQLSINLQSSEEKVKQKQKQLLRQIHSQSSFAAQQLTNMETAMLKMKEQIQINNINQQKQKQRLQEEIRKLTFLCEQQKAQITNLKGNKFQPESNIAQSKAQTQVSIQINDSDLNLISGIETRSQILNQNTNPFYETKGQNNEIHNEMLKKSKKYSDDDNAFINEQSLGKTMSLKENASNNKEQEQKQDYFDENVPKQQQKNQLQTICEKMISILNKFKQIQALLLFEESTQGKQQILSSYKDEQNNSVQNNNENKLNVKSIEQKQQNQKCNKAEMITQIQKFKSQLEIQTNKLLSWCSQITKGQQKQENKKQKLDFIGAILAISNNKENSSQNLNKIDEDKQKQYKNQFPKEQKQKNKQNFEINEQISLILKLLTQDHHEQAPEKQEQEKYQSLKDETQTKQSSNKQIVQQKSQKLEEKSGNKQFQEQNIENKHGIKKQSQQNVKNLQKMINQISRKLSQTQRSNKQRIERLFDVIRSLILKFKISHKSIEKIIQDKQFVSGNKNKYDHLRLYLRALYSAMEGECMNQNCLKSNNDQSGNKIQISTPIVTMFDSYEDKMQKMNTELSKLRLQLDQKSKQYIQLKSMATSFLDLEKQIQKNVLKDSSGQNLNYLKIKGNFSETDTIKNNTSQKSPQSPNSMENLENESDEMKELKQKIQFYRKKCEKYQKQKTQDGKRNSKVIFIRK